MIYVDRELGNKLRPSIQKLATILRAMRVRLAFYLSDDKLTLWNFI